MMHKIFQKSGQYYFDKLSPIEQKKFETNGKKYLSQDGYLRYLKRKSKNQTQFITEAFIWDDTPEEYAYWHNISQREIT